MDTPNEGKNVTAFLSENAGIYLYRPIFRRFMLCLGIFFLLGFPLAAYDHLSVGQNSTYQVVRASLALAIAPYIIWSSLVCARKFKELRIDHDGISIMPFGLHISPDDIEEIRRSENYAGAGTIELKLKFRSSTFHLNAWSWGRKLTIAFNDRLLTPVAAPS